MRELAYGTSRYISHIDSTGFYLKEPGSNGLLWDSKRQQLILCDHGNRHIARLGAMSSARASLTVSVAEYADINGSGKPRRLNSPNDLAMAPDGSIW